MSAILYYALIPTIVAILGGILGVRWTPSVKVISASQHFAAGIVIAAVSVDLMPKLLKFHSLFAICVGFIIGVALMLYIKKAFGENESDSSSKSLLIVVLIDLFIDGLLVGVAFAVSHDSALLIAIALAFEVSFLSLTTISVLKRKQWDNTQLVFATIFIAAVILVGAFVGGLFLQFLRGNMLAAVIAFGVAALLYLAVEELISEAHESEDTWWITAMFFLGFLAIIIIDKLFLS